jgi:hypothetical protein
MGDQAWVLPFCVIMRYVRWIHQHLLIWLEITDTVRRLKELGMSETGMQARLQALGGGPIAKQLIYLGCMVRKLRTSLARVIKEAYAGSVGLEEVGRHRGPQPFLADAQVSTYCIDIF